MNLLIKLYLWLVRDRWTIGFVEEPIESIVNGKPFSIRYLSDAPKDRWYADPFILNCDESIIELLVEEWLYKEHKGCIARLVINRVDFSIIEDSVILNLDTHLSFPFIQRINNRIYVCPENANSGSWTQYEYIREENRLVRVKTIVPEPLTDAVITNLFDDDLIFSTSLPKANGSLLSVYNKEGNKIRDIKLESNVARGAGNWFKIGNRVYRPAQDCNTGYGTAVIIQEVIPESDNNFVIKDIIRIKSPHPVYSRGLHTLNSFNGLSVVDLRGYKRERLGRLTDYLKNLKK